MQRTASSSSQMDGALCFARPIIPCRKPAQFDFTTYLVGVDALIGPYKFYRTFPTSIRRKSRARLWSMESPENHPKGSLVVSFFSWRCDTVLFFLRIEKEKNGVAKFVSFSEGGKEMVSRKMQAANGFPYDEHSKCTTKSRPALWPGGMLLF